MNTDRIRMWQRAAVLGSTLAGSALLTGCQYGEGGEIRSASTFGEANRQTMMAQVVDPDPQYEYLDPATSGDRAAQAIDRYRKGTVKQPDKVTSTQISGSGSR